jgi:curved DNA-binding protein CbpA
MNYFQSCSTLDEAKALYKKLAFQLHPDVSGRDSKAEFQEMCNQFEKFKPQAEKYQTEWEQWSASDYMQIIDELLKIPNLEIELIGSFIWVGGDTRAAKDRLKAIQNDLFKPAQWHKKKMLWYFAPADYRKFSKKEYSMDDLRAAYGSQTFERNNRSVTK